MGLTLHNTGSWWNGPHKLLPRWLALSPKSLEVSQTGSRKGELNVEEGEDKLESQDELEPMGTD